eukprot:1483819-Alexandrium_andersonii.AAC.1
MQKEPNRARRATTRAVCCVYCADTRGGEARRLGFARARVRAGFGGPDFATETAGAASAR